jgi:hypothetical protein
VVRAPAAHAGGQVARIAVGGGAGGHDGLLSMSRAQAA